MEQFTDQPTLGVILYGNSKKLTPEYIQSRLRETITLIAAAFPQSEGYKWLSDRWLFIHQAPQRLIAKDDPVEYAWSRCRQVEPRNQGVQMVVDFNESMIPTVVKTSWKIDLNSALNMFLYLGNNDELKNLIELFAFATSSPTLLGHAYPNQNLQLSFLWTIVDTLMPSGKFKRPLDCPSCGHKFSEDISMPTKKRIENFVPTLPLNDGDIDLMITFLRKLNSRIRSPFFHGAKRTTTADATSKLVNKLGKNNFTFKEDIEHADGRIGGTAILEAILRRLLFERLNSIRTD